MLSDEQFQIVRPRLTVLQIIVGVMCGGVLMFALVTNLMSPWAQSAMDISMLPLLGAAASFFLMILSFVMPALVASSVPQTESDDDRKPNLEQAAGVFMTGRIIRVALLEGICFLNLVVYLLEESWLSLIAVAIGLFLLFLAFPTARGMRRWLEAKLGD